MADEAFVLKRLSDGVVFDELLVQASDFTIAQNEEIVILESEEIPNNSGTIYNSIDIRLDFEELVPSVNFGSFKIISFVDAKNALGRWEVLGQTWDSLRGTGEAQSREISISLNHSSDDSGIDDTLYFETEILRISRTRHRVPDTVLRVRVVLVETDVNGASAFQSVKISGTGRLHNE